jgi:hypothetical protein
VAALALYLAWLATVVFLAAHHVFWRDEVRAMTNALRGDNLAAMLIGMRVDGAPALWYLLLRGAHALVARPEILPILALSVAAAAMLVLVLCSPFELPLIALVLFGRFCVFEYSVMARNYGISVLLLFIVAAVYARHRDRGYLLGGLLLLLANTNVHSAILTLAFLLFWFIDTVVRDAGVRRRWALKVFLPNLMLAAAGIELCRLTTVATFAEVRTLYPHGALFTALVRDIVFPAAQFAAVVPGGPLVGSLILFGSLLGLIRRPAALVAGLAALLGFSLLFGQVYPGDYRHAALWLVFLVVMYWLAGSDVVVGARASSSMATRAMPMVALVGSYGFLLIVALQVPAGIGAVANAATGGPPMSRSRDLSLLIAAHRELHAATIVADPDYLVEPLHYYLTNPTYLIRERRFGDVVNFTRKSHVDISLGDVTRTARDLNRSTRLPVVILLMQRLTGAATPRVYKESYYWTFATTPEQERIFRSSTTRIASFGPAQSDETFDVYVFDRRTRAQVARSLGPTR